MQKGLCQYCIRPLSSIVSLGQARTLFGPVDNEIAELDDVKPILFLLALMLITACGEDAAPPQNLSRVGESCQSNDECRSGLACLQTELRCVILCTPDSRDCGEGIDCLPAGGLGFCPLPPQ